MRTCFILLFLIRPAFSLEMSYSLIDIENSKVITQKNSSQEMVLASVSKIFTNYYALKKLGAQFQFNTSLYYEGAIKENILKGNIYLKGSGDPYLTSQHLNSFVHHLLKLGIRKIDGEFYIDDKSFPFSERINSLGLEDQPDNPSFGALNADFNRIKLWQYGSETVAPLKHIKLTPKKVYSHGLRYRQLPSPSVNEFWQVNTEEPKIFSEDIPTRHASYFTAELFRGMASNYGITLPSPKKKSLPKKATRICSHKSLPLIRLSALSLEYSNNLMAESILLAAANLETSSPLSLKDSAKKMKSWYQKEFKNLKFKNTSFENGSGLSLKNTTSSQELAELLANISYDTFDERSFWSLLSISGHSGSLLKRLHSPEYAYHVFAKTGSLYFINNLAGYILTKSGKKLAFVIMTADKRRNQLTSENSAKNKKLRDQSRGWYRTSSKKIDELIKKWISKY